LQASGAKSERQLYPCMEAQEQSPMVRIHRPLPQERRIIITHDRKTMPKHAADLIGAGKNIAGVVLVPRSLPLLQAIEDLELMITCSANDEWVNVIRYLPF